MLQRSPSRGLLLAPRQLATLVPGLCFGLLLGCVYENEGNDQEFGPAGDIQLTPSEVAPETNFWSTSGTTDGTATTGTGTGTGTGTTGGGGSASTTTTTTGSGESSSETGAGDEAGMDDAAGDEDTEETGDQCIEADWQGSLDCPSRVGFSSCSEGFETVDSSETPMWKSNPPHSGPHYEDGVEWGEHEEPLVRAEWLENLHQGGIVFLYNCEDDAACADDIERLRNAMKNADEAAGKIILAPDPELDPSEPFAAVAWTWLYLTDRVSATTFKCFAEQHVDQVPEEEQED